MGERDSRSRRKRVFIAVTAVALLVVGIALGREMRFGPTPDHTSSGDDGDLWVLLTGASQGLEEVEQYASLDEAIAASDVTVVGRIVDVVPGRTYGDAVEPDGRVASVFLTIEADRTIAGSVTDGRVFVEYWLIDRLPAELPGLTSGLTMPANRVLAILRRIPEASAAAAVSSWIDPPVAFRLVNVRGLIVEDDAGRAGLPLDSVSSRATPGLSEDSYRNGVVGRPFDDVLVDASR